MRKEGIQIGLFEQEMLKPVDLHKEPPSDIVVVQKTIEVLGKEIPYAEVQHKPKIALGVTACPVCGGEIILASDGTMRCLECKWFQGLSE